MLVGIDNKRDKNNTERKQDSLKIQSLIRERIKKIMKEKNLRQKDLVEKTGISQVFLSYFLNGKSNIGVDSLCKIAKALDVRIEYLLQDDPVDFLCDKKVNSVFIKGESVQDIARKKVKKIMEERGIKYKYLVEKTGLSRVFLSYFLSDKRNISVNALEKIAKALDVSVDFLTRKEQKEIPSVKDIGKEVEFIPIVAAVKAGSPDSPVEYQYKEKFFPYKESLHCDECYIIEVNGDSMSPTLEKGDCILVKPIEKYPMLIPENFDGKIVVAANENWEYTIKRLKKAGDEWILISDNPNYPIIKTNGWHIIGVALKRFPKSEDL